MADGPHAITLAEAALDDENFADNQLNRPFLSSAALAASSLESATPAE